MAALLTILKLKKGKSTYTLTISSPVTLEAIREQLSLAINNSGGLPEADENATDQMEEGVDEDEENIPVPKSEFEQVEQVEQDEEIINHKSLIPEEIINHKLVIPEELRVAVPQNPAAPFDNQWIELNKDNFKQVSFKDFDILAFSTTPGVDFEIVEAAFIE
ncbi:hypothetical protein KGF56_004377 [Candida oxycetoniae]|uniref:Uncharacterized protein n=1 Tax=Candida oxycetoniae TaxID=497107 RepID=A0AAI9WW90_9ASCO|nr:uncharacterized protein KGF56_004377 [Candida oxycetoniae]KAI3402916.1 hypothetical protein KGF56_004377 [Candida oxycetoniae]